jgi:hypothetical protein
LKITVECESPKYAKGKSNFAKLEDVYEFLVRIRGFPRGNIGSFLLTIAKDGCIHGAYTARYGLKITSDFHDYALAQKVATETGLSRAFGRISPRLDIALSFAKAFDKEADKK